MSLLLLLCLPYYQTEEPEPYEIQNYPPYIYQQPDDENNDYEKDHRSENIVGPKIYWFNI